MALIWGAPHVRASDFPVETFPAIPIATDSTLRDALRFVAMALLQVQRHAMAPTLTERTAAARGSVLDNLPAMLRAAVLTRPIVRQNVAMVSLEGTSHAMPQTSEAGHVSTSDLTVDLCTAR